METGQLAAALRNKFGSPGGRESRWFGVWFGWQRPLKVRTKTPMTASGLISLMDPCAVKEREYLHGPMTVEAVTRYRYDAF